MPPQAPREQEQSIKARKQELFEAEEVSLERRRPFSAYLAETEATPLTTGQKAALWGVGLLVLLLLVAALATMPGPRSSHINNAPAKDATAAHGH